MSPVLQQAKYCALVATASEIIWLQQLLQDFQISSPVPTLLFCDNQTAIHIAHNALFHELTKDIEIDFHFIPDHIQSRCLKLFPIRS